jgi:hypothetical protein
VIEGKYVPGANYTLRENAGVAQKGPGVEHVGELQANDPVSGKTVWRVPWKTVNMAPVMATAGDLVFQGGPNNPRYPCNPRLMVYVGQSRSCSKYPQYPQQLSQKYWIHDKNVIIVQWVGISVQSRRRDIKL